MRWLGRLSRDQRVVLIAALGITLGVLAGYLSGLGNRSGWYAYAPLTAQSYHPPATAEPGWLRLAIWMAAAVLWVLASVWLLRPLPPQRSPGRPAAPSPE